MEILSFAKPFDDMLCEGAAGASSLPAHLEVGTRPCFCGVPRSVLPSSHRCLGTNWYCEGPLLSDYVIITFAAETTLARVGFPLDRRLLVSAPAREAP